MNMREGMRRVGIVLGALGCVAGGAFGYWNLQNVWSSHTRFERLQALPVMHDVNAAIKGYQDSLAKQHESAAKSGNVGDWVDVKPPKTLQEHGPWEKYASGPKPETAPKTLPADFFDKTAKKYGLVPAESAQQIEGLPPGAIVRPIAPEQQEFTNIRPIRVSAVRKADWFEVNSPEVADPSAEITIDVAEGTDGVQTVNADKAGAISSIQLTTGEWVRRGSKTLKARLAFIASLLLPFCYPVIGFLVPWGAVRVFVWVASGFFAPRSSA